MRTTLALLVVDRRAVSYSMRNCQLFGLAFRSAAVRFKAFYYLSLIVVLGVPLVAQAVSQRIEVLQGGALVGVIDPYTGTLTGAANYHYDQPNGSPISGPASVAFEGRIFFYDGSDGLHFNVIFNTEAIGRGSVDWTIAVAGSTTNPLVKLSDDPAPPADHVELLESPNDFFTGAWSYAGNTDGGVIGPFAGSAWTITVNQILYASSNDRGITSLRAFDDSGSSLPLNLNSGSTGQLIFRPQLVPEPATATMAAIVLASATVCLRRRRSG